MSDQQKYLCTRRNGYYPNGNSQTCFASYDDHFCGAYGKCQYKVLFHEPENNLTQHFSLHDKVLAWLGCCRDHMQPEDVKTLQEILKSTQASNAAIDTIKKILVLCEDVEGHLLENIKPYDDGHSMLHEFIENIYKIIGPTGYEININ